MCGVQGLVFSMVIVRIGLGITSTSGETGETLANSTSQPTLGSRSKIRRYDDSVRLGTFAAKGTTSVESITTKDGTPLESFRSKDVEHGRI